MTAHSNAEILTAYANNTDLVIFMLGSSSKWHRTNPKALMDYPDDEFFACLPQHKEACLHWLNGGEVHQSPVDESSWVVSADAKKVTWMPWSSFMNDDLIFRIKPRKEKRWICITNDLEIEDGTLYESYSDAEENSPSDKQIVEIEVEV